MVQKADVAQKAFLSNITPSLHLVLPALELLHNAWTDHSKNPKYGAFVGPLGEGIEKIAMTRHLFQTHSISQCVNLIVSMCYSSAHFAFLLVLHPQMKMAYFKAH